VSFDRRAVLLSYLDTSRQHEVAALEDLTPRLEAMVAEARAAWPTVELDEERFLQALADKLCERTTESAQRVLETLPAGALSLATACAAGDDAALAAFRDALLPALRRALGKLGASGAAADEVEQQLLVMLFVAESGRPHIASYGGRGRLQSWLLSVGVRTARRLLGAAAGEGGDDDLARLSDALENPELTVLRERYREQVRQSFAAALQELEPRQRTLLRQYHIDRLTIDQLAALHRVNRSTTARWVVAARSAALELTRAHLSRTFGIAPTEVDSIIRLVRSQLDFSLRELG